MIIFLNDNLLIFQNFRPLGSILFNNIIEGSNRILNNTNSNINISEQEITVIERSANILILLFICGGQLASELATVLNTTHIDSKGE